MFTAYFLLKSGHEVTIVDKNQTTVPTSVNNAGSLSPGICSRSQMEKLQARIGSHSSAGSPLFFVTRNNQESSLVL